jgi:hypothetical protein
MHLTAHTIVIYSRDVRITTPAKLHSWHPVHQYIYL